METNYEFMEIVSEEVRAEFCGSKNEDPVTRTVCVTANDHQSFEEDAEDVKIRVRELLHMKSQVKI